MAIPNTTPYKTWDLTANNSGLDFGAQFAELLANDIELQSLIDDLESANTTLDGRVTANETDIATAQGDITALEGRADALEAFQADPFDNKALQIKDGSSNVVFQVDKDTAAMSAGYESTVGTDYATTLHRFWGARAWVAFRGTGTPSVLGSANVSSLDDDGTGLFGMNFTVSLPDTLYSVVTGQNRVDADTNLGMAGFRNKSTAGVDFLFGNNNAALEDPYEGCMGVFR
ncbi:MAG: hypothetical protein CMF59_12570 [Leptospiraceae bacterium]|nr:hypothetical protein [Leptospiraceae bacterium]